MDKKADLAKLINLLLEYEQKLESCINKKYKAFIRSVVNYEALTKNIKPQELKIKRELIIFKLGLESKSVKCVILSLQYLLRILQAGFIGFNDPAYSEHYIIGESDIKEQDVNGYMETTGQMLKRVLVELIHFKNDEANALIAKILEYFIGDDILSTILSLSIKPPPNYSTLLYSFLSYRFYLYEECCVFTEKELEIVNTQIAKDQRLNKQISGVLERCENLQNFLSIYVQEIVDRAAQDGGKYGYCVICKEKADFHCKQTHASLCGTDCKAKHLEISSKFHEDYLKANLLLEENIKSLDQTLSYVGRESSEIKQKSIILQILNTILRKPSLFFMVKTEIVNILKKYMPNIIGKLLSLKENYYTELAFSLMCSLVKYFKSSFINEIEYFFNTEVLSVLQEKKPRYDTLLINYAFLAQIASNGRHILELYINLDCRLNRDNTVERVMYEFGKILQDRFENFGYLSKHQKGVLKGQCLEIHRVLFNSLSQFKKQYPQKVNIEPIMAQKNRKVNLEKFVFKFNESWSAGLKALYNFNLISLDDQELIEILVNTSRLKKTEIQTYLMDEARKDLLQIYFDSLKIAGKQLIIALFDFYKIFPIKQGNLPHKLFVEQYLKSNPEYKNIEEEMDFWFRILSKDLKKFSVTELSESLRIKHIQMSEQQIVDIYKLIWQLQKPLTTGNHPQSFIFCNSQQDIEIIGSQLNLLQISVSHLLQSFYELPKTLQLALKLQMICSSANLFTLLIKSTSFEYIASTNLQPQNIQIIKFLLETPQTIPDYVPDWLPLIRFYNDIYYFSVSACLTPVLLANKTLILNNINVHNIEVNLIRIGSEISEGSYPKFMLAMLKIGAMESQYDRTLMLQKFFEIFEMNIPKSIKAWPELFPKISTTCLNNCFNLHSQIGIYTVDLVKQNFLKLLQAKLDKDHQIKYLELLQEIYVNAKHQEVKEFIISCLAVIVENQFELCEASWRIALNLFIEALNLNSSTVREIIDAVLEKIFSENEHLRYLLNFYEDIVLIMLRMVTPHQHKIAIKTIPNIRVLIDFLLKQSSGAKAPLVLLDQEYKLKCRELVQKLMPQILLGIADKISYDCHDTLFEVFFVLMKRNQQQEQPIMPAQTVNAVYDRMYDAMIELCRKNDARAVMIAEKFISDNVGWQARLKHFYSLECMSRCIIDHYNNLSLIAIKGIKSFMQILNPHTEQQWSHFTSILLKIINDCRINNIAAIQRISGILGPPKDMLELITQSRGIRDVGEPMDSEYLTNQLIIQKLCVELLPNDSQCLRTLVEIYNQVNEFNDNVQLRCVLWKKGLGIGCPELPSLILLEEKVINRILSIYNCSKDHQNFYQFAIEMLSKYCIISRKLGTVESLMHKQDWDNIQFELITVYMKHLQQRKQLLIKIVNYLLPKLVDAKMNASTAIRLGNTVIDLLEFSQAKDLQIKLLRNLAEQPN